ncbi:translation initiation factor IF-2-like [Sorex araneus]|uniref:translation initiation factor IF-2-like n=1 Tax=Sorex araneus TaxID=42254 RepID=UPI002433D364|nr:translation initiation factor IF-2-like [Sorex araneus]
MSLCRRKNAGSSFTESYETRVRWSFRPCPPPHSREPARRAPARGARKPAPSTRAARAAADHGAGGSTGVRPSRGGSTDPASGGPRRRGLRSLGGTAAPAPPPRLLASPALRRRHAPPLGPRAPAPPPPHTSITTRLRRPPAPARQRAAPARAASGPPPPPASRRAPQAPPHGPKHKRQPESSSEKEAEGGGDFLATNVPNTSESLIATVPKCQASDILAPTPTPVAAASPRSFLKSQLARRCGSRA